MIDLSKGKWFGIDLVLSDYHNDIRVAIFSMDSMDSINQFHDAYRELP